MFKYSNCHELKQTDIKNQVLFGIHPKLSLEIRAFDLNIHTYVYFVYTFVIYKLTYIFGTDFKWYFRAFSI